MSPPLWMPVGSVRSILAFGIVGVAAYCEVRGIQSEWIRGAAMIVLGIYFGSREKNPPNGDHTEQPPENRPMENPPRADQP